MNLSRGYLVALFVVFAYLSWQLIDPFLQYVLAAVLVAFLLSPIQRRLEQSLSKTIVALALVALALVGFIVPFALVAFVVADDAANILQEVEPEALRLTEIEDAIDEELGVTVDITEAIVDSAEQIGTIMLEQTTAWLEVLTHTLIGIGLALFLLFYLLKDGDVLLDWVRQTTPLPDDVQDDLYDELEEVTWAVLAGHVLIAVVEGVIAGLGLFATGIPNAAFWTFVMVIFSLIPLIGAFIVWGPAVAYLFATGEPVLALGLAVYSAIVVGVADDYLRPIVVDRYAEISPAVIILGVLGGIYAFGIMGLFFGPVVVGALIATLSVIDDHYERLEGGTGTEY
ncbi:AI-2E family transporter [Natronobacterium gregoryi]|uniref:AI-2E family transporter n=2 Tax=Natronobacterium gregoryi TaxID=44930 RepID=L0AG22_NATGS|nr:AI-2E family transporter [Natronobacterium gregoryi]AFZ72369.1 putative permease [Natronobacterium gregoryi SP2]PLK20359.1 AI-2E family transporter [Natronobacterium gregoryi SP2]SFJ22083.1 Predicted PurR-regulated permease PerM [Natronobacterium gregoryi]